jgi:hypothetical protein
MPSVRGCSPPEVTFQLCAESRKSSRKGRAVPVFVVLSALPRTGELIIRHSTSPPNDEALARPLPSGAKVCGTLELRCVLQLS